MYVMVISALIILVGASAAIRKVDIRLVLMVCAAAFFVLAGNLAGFFVVVATEMTNQKTVVPICSAMGFAYVVKQTGCDRHLIHLLTAPLRFVKPLLVPGGVSVGYLVNMAIVSQSSTSATVGPVLVPVLTAASITIATAGSVLLLGSSMGGELFNPGAVEIVTLSSLVTLDPTSVVLRVVPANLVACIPALGVFWFLAIRDSRRTAESGPADAPQTSDVRAAEPANAFRLNVAKALVPVLPLALLFLARLVTLPATMTESIQISAAMLAGTVAAALVAPAEIKNLALAFCEGAGYAYGHVISLIVTATVFTEGIKANGLIESLVNAVSAAPVLTITASVVIPLTLAVVSGSGIAPAVAVMKVLVPVAGGIGLDPIRIGALIAVSAQLGRTMSPAAAVVRMSSVVSGVSPEILLRRVAPALLSGAAVMLLAALFGLI